MRLLTCISAMTLGALSAAGALNKANTVISEEILLKLKCDVDEFLYLPCA